MQRSRKINTKKKQNIDLCLGICFCRHADRLIMTKRMLWFDKNKQFVKAGYRGQCRKGSDKEGDVFLRGNSVGGVPSGLFI